jgi:hypothetical protein
LSFSVLGGSAVTNVGPSVISDDLGVSTGSSITGFPPGIVNGTQHPNDAVAAQAQSDLTTAYNNAAGQAPDASLPPDIGGLTFDPGVYNASSSLGLTGTVTLDAHGNGEAVFIFQVGSTLTTASASSVLLINGADPCKVFWQIGSSATLGTTTAFAGTIMALTSATLTTGASVNGRVLARNGAVTLGTNVITTPDCTDGGGGGVDTEGTDTEGTTTEGTDTQGTTTEGTDTQGTDTEGTTTEGADTEGTTTEGTDTQGTDTQGTDTQGTDTEGTTTEATDTEGTSTEATDTQGTDIQGTDTQGTDIQGTDTQGTDTQGTDTQGTDTQGTDTQGTDTEGTDTEGSDTNGTEDHHDHDVVPQGHPATGMGGAASGSSNPYSVVLLSMGGVAGIGALLVLAPSLRRSTRKQS